MKRTTKDLVVLVGSGFILFLALAWALDVALYWQDVVQLGRSDWYVAQVWEAWAAAAVISMMVFQGMLRWVRDERYIRQLEGALKATTMELARLDEESRGDPVF